jgi:beta-glucosidase
VNPSGKLPFTYPKYMLGTNTYDHTYSEAIDTQFGMNAFNPEWSFGYGLSYSTFTYSNLEVVGNRVWVDVTNTSDRAGNESVLVYVSDEVASLPPAVKRLKGFKKVLIPAKQTVRVEVELADDAYRFANAEGKWVFEPGAFVIRVGNLEKRIEL